MTLIRNIKGLTSKTGLKVVPLMVHFTSDNRGETLSIGSLSEGVMYTCRYSDIEEIVKSERDKGYTNGHLIIDETSGKKKK